DVPAAARAVAAVDRAEHDASRRSASALIADLGAIAPASLLDNARSFGLSGRPPLTLDWLYRKAHQLWRGAGQLAGQTPARAPVHADIVARLVRERPLDTLAAAHPDADSRSDQPALRFDSGSRRRAIVRHQSRTRSTRALADRLAIVAAIFDGSRVELRHARGRRAARRVIAHACERFEIAGASARLVAGSKIERAAATITVQAHGH
ncbi:MAG: hypothetical protein KC503_05930, partial [Myxococcales bacterium]|nr:hypothetical protein [Myxococcales bacterium]